MDKKPNIPDAVPKASSEPLPEIAEFLDPFAPLFRRSQSRHSLERYMTGLLTDLDRKNCATIAAALAGTSTERLQHLLTDADWDSLEPSVLAGTNEVVLESSIFGSLSYQARPVRRGFRGWDGAKRTPSRSRSHSKPHLLPEVVPSCGKS